MLVGGGAVLSPKLVVAGFVGLGFVVASVQSLALGLALFTVLTFFLRIPGLSSGGVTFARMAGILLTALWLLRVVNRTSRPRLLTQTHPLLAYNALLLAGWSFASVLWATSPGAAEANAFRLTQGLLLVFVLFSGLTERRHVWWITWGFIAGALLSAVVGLAGATPADTIQPSARIRGGIGDPNELAATLIPALAFAFFAFATVRNVVLNWLLLTCAIVSMLALFRTESRGGVIGLTVMLVATLILAGPVRVRAVFVVLATSAFGLVYFTLIAPPHALARITHFGSGTGRTDLWTIALRMFGDHPVVGVGAGNFQVVEPTYALADIPLRHSALIVQTTQPVHNTYLHVFVELGVVGGVLFLTLIGGALVLAYRAVRVFARSGDREMEILSRGLIVGTIGMLAAFTFISSQYEKQLPLLVGTLAALLAIARLGGSPRRPPPSRRLSSARRARGELPSPAAR